MFLWKYGSFREFLWESFGYDLSHKITKNPLRTLHSQYKIHPIMTLYNKGLDDFTDHMTLYIPLSIIFQSCLGSVAAMFILMASKPTFHFLDLTLVVSFAMAYNGALYAQMKPKVVFNLLLLTVLVHITFLILNLVRLS